MARGTAGIAQAHTLRQRVSSIRAISRQLGVNRRTVEKWLKLPPPDASLLASIAAAAELPPTAEPPPSPWHDWDQVRRLRAHLRLYRTLFLHKTENLTLDERATLAELFASPVGGELRVAREFLEAWFDIWKDDRGRRALSPMLSSATRRGRATRKQRSCGRYDASNSTWTPTTSLGSAPSCETQSGKRPTTQPSVLDARSDTANTRISDFAWRRLSAPT
jgi:hypothetical protein